MYTLVPVDFSDKFEDYYMSLLFSFRWIYCIGFEYGLIGCPIIGVMDQLDLNYQSCIGAITKLNPKIVGQISGHHTKGIAESSAL